MRGVILLALSACSGPGDDVPGHGSWIEEKMSEGRATCLRERCAIATGASLEMEAWYRFDDTAERGWVTAVAGDPADVVEASLQVQAFTLRGLTAGATRVTVTGHLWSPTNVHTWERDVQVVDGVERIVAHGGGYPPAARDLSGGVLADSAVVLLLDRAAATGEPLLGDNQEPWTIQAADSTLTPTGFTGVRQRLQAGAPGTATVRVGATTRAIPIVPVAAVAAMRLTCDTFPELSARDGETIHLPTRGTFSYQLELFDGGGRHLEGDGGGAVRVNGVGVRPGGLEYGLSYRFDGVDQLVTIVAGARTFRVTLDYP
jgi:hypothetical protein